MHCTHCCCARCLHLFCCALRAALSYSRSARRHLLRLYALHLLSCALSLSAALSHCAVVHLFVAARSRRVASRCCGLTLASVLKRNASAAHTLHIARPLARSLRRRRRRRLCRGCVVVASPFAQFVRTSAAAAAAVVFFFLFLLLLLRFALVTQFFLFFFSFC